MTTQRSLLAFIAAMIVTVAFCIGCASAQTATPLIVGDLDRNGLIDSRDVRMLLLHLTGTQPLDASLIQQADVSGDGKVNTIDVHEVLVWVANEKTATAPTITTTTTTVPTTTTTRAALDDDGYYEDIFKP